jgi:hypothetical protein
MKHPGFFDEAPRLTVYDPLSAFLGATEDGLVEYTYLDVVKLAGHSCPTVAGAYLMTLRALRHLYQGEIPIRGDIDVALGQEATDGVAGVIASVATLVTGAAGEGGFKGSPDGSSAATGSPSGSASAGRSSSPVATRVRASSRACTPPPCRCTLMPARCFSGSLAARLPRRRPRSSAGCGRSG